MEKTEQLRTLYLAKMVPHLLPREGRKYGISITQKEAWHELAQQLRGELIERFNKISYEEIVEDLSFNGVPAVIAFPNEKNFRDNDLIVNSVEGASDNQKAFMINARHGLLNTIDPSICVFEEMLIQHDIRVYLQYPLLIDGKLYFVNVYLPDYDIAFLVDKNEINMDTFRGKHRVRYDTIKTACKDVIYISREQAIDKKYFEEHVFPMLSE